MPLVDFRIYMFLSITRKSNKDRNIIAPKMPWYTPITMLEMLKMLVIIAKKPQKTRSTERIAVTIFKRVNS